MAWIEVNSHLDDTYGYFHGYGHDDGWFCFKRGEDDWIVANSFEPYITDSAFGNFYVEPYTYNEHPVFRNTAKTMYLFKSKSPGQKWIVFDRLQEPISYLDIDLSTLIGDGWYELNNEPSFELTSMSEQLIAYGAGIYSDSPYITMTNEFQCYEYQPKSSPWPWEPGDTIPFGRYESEDGDWKIVGNPVWKTWSYDSAVTNLSVNYVGRDEFNNKVFRVGSMTLQKNANNVLTIGTLSVGRWYEGQEYPSPDTTVDVKFSAYEIQDGTKTAITSGDIDIDYSHTARGEMSAFCYMGEIAQWH